MKRDLFSTGEMIRQPSPGHEPAHPAGISAGLLRIFGRYSEHYVARHFHSVRLLANGAPKTCFDVPLVLYLNHSSWWDPIVCLLLARRFFPRRKSYGPIDAAALQRYAFLERLGFFGVEHGTGRGARNFRKRAEAILRQNDSALWLTPQGMFIDNRPRPLYFQSGLGRLAHGATSAAFQPLAIEYTFWEERLPEVLISFGEAVIFEQPRSLNVPDATDLFEAALASVQDQLSAASQRRQREEWRVLVEGGAGTTRVYDWWRRAHATLRRQKFHSAHSEL
ncbi:MAG: 1-acyl-sn-glycerol-3-phosphate acyltransferase [Chthoniobacterales bacterium]|nr:1-acyl-sn-glycerol-3-phosphate acyltransferase [Chthoniobacterales bacterium]